MQALPLSRDEVRSVIAGTGAASRIPCLLHFWTRPEMFARRTAEVQRNLPYVAAESPAPGAA